MKEPGVEIIIRIPRAQIFVWLLVIVIGLIAGAHLYYLSIIVNSFESVQRQEVDLAVEKNNIRSLLEQNYYDKLKELYGTLKNESN